MKRHAWPHCIMSLLKMPLWATHYYTLTMMARKDAKGHGGGWLLQAELPMSLREANEGVLMKSTPVGKGRQQDGAEGGAGLQCSLLKGCSQQHRKLKLEWLFRVCQAEIKAQDGVPLHESIIGIPWERGRTLDKTTLFSEGDF